MCTLAVLAVPLVLLLLVVVKAVLFSRAHPSESDRMIHCCCMLLLLLLSLLSCSDELPAGLPGRDQE
jgi:hypothetical protein